jgi:hypothetical protein
MERQQVEEMLQDAIADYKKVLSSRWSTIGDASFQEGRICAYCAVLNRKDAWELIEQIQQEAKARE